ncbi:MAG: hypothetical protein LUE98_08315 [Tannerellaceae bacterium]|nr:hypothetical protein [Tannerellaceae bacterium]
MANKMRLRATQKTVLYLTEKEKQKGRPTDNKAANPAGLSKLPFIAES